MKAVEIIPVALSRDVALIAHAAAFLDEEEQRRAARFVVEEPRMSFTVARAVLRILLGQRLGIAPAAVRFTYGAYGKPAVNGDLRFNLSHAGSMALYGFAWGREIGVDIEHHRRQTDRMGIAQRFFHPDECARILQLPEQLREKAFYDVWSRKEAYIKATGMGLSLPLTGFQVPVAGGELRKWREDQREWTMWLPPREIAGYSHAMVYEGAEADVLDAGVVSCERILTAP